MAWPTAVFQEHEVASALRDLFGQVCYQEQGQNPHQPVGPTFLRHALADLPGARFQVGEMSDAGEVVMVLYEQLAPVAIKANQPGLLNHRLACMTRKRCTAIEAQSLKSCDDENGGCQVRKCVLHSLVSQPAKVFTMQLAWQTDNESKQDITAAMLGLREVLDLADMYLGIEHEAFVYHMRSMVCYYGQHYIAYVLLSDSLCQLVITYSSTTLRNADASFAIA
ncbi:hypothetical protein WJX79_001147 [Trebouxia sp. C0005]